MSLKSCLVCHRLFNARELNCPHCGKTVYPLTVGTVAGYFVITLVLLAVLTAVGSVTMLVRAY